MRERGSLQGCGERVQYSGNSLFSVRFDSETWETEAAVLLVVCYMILNINRTAKKDPRDHNGQ